MGAEGRIYYYIDTQTNSFLPQLLESLAFWLSNESNMNEFSFVADDDMIFKCEEDEDASDEV